MKKGILTLGIVVALVAVLAVPMAALADHTSGQGASTIYSEAIQIRNVMKTMDVGLITFPSSPAGTEVTNPYNDQGDMQILTVTAGDAEPVAVLVSVAAYTIWYQVTAQAGWDGTVSGENLWTIAEAGDLDKTTFDSNCTTISTWDTPTSTSPAQTVGPGNDKELYLTVDLKNVAGRSGQSVLIVLGES